MIAIYNAAISYAWRGTWLPVQHQHMKESASEHHMPKMRQKFFAAYSWIPICMDKSHLLYTAPSVWECHWNRPLPRQCYQMLPITETRETYSIFLQSSRRLYGIWGKVTQEEQLYWEKWWYREEKNNYETFNFLKTNSRTSGINVCNTINLNRVIAHIVIRMLHVPSHSKSMHLSLAYVKTVLRSFKLNSLFEMKFSVTESAFFL